MDEGEKSVSFPLGSDPEVAAQLQRVHAEIYRLLALVPVLDLTKPSDGVTPQWIRGMLRARRKRDVYFGADLFADPAWDILLEVYALELVGERGAISQICKAARVPATTALRWIERLESRGLLVRQPHPVDKRISLLGLSSGATAAMNEYFSNTRQERVTAI